MKIRILKLGSVCKDRATELEGTLTHWVGGMAHTVDYYFQPKGLSVEDQQPLTHIALEAERLDVTEDMYHECDVPFDILGTKVTDKASGFTGMAVALVMHINGCFHVSIQPAGTLGSSGLPVRRRDFDLRGCEGERIPKLTEKELVESKVERPSPTGDDLLGYRPESVGG